MSDLDHKPTPDEVGYVFRKFFPGHGWFQGTVKKIRPNAARRKTRRVVYSDGDMEDMTLQEVRKQVDSHSSRKMKRNTMKEQIKIPAPRAAVVRTKKAKSKQVIKAKQSTSAKPGVRIKILNRRSSDVGKDVEPKTTEVTVEDQQGATAKKSGGSAMLLRNHDDNPLDKLPDKDSGLRPKPSFLELRDQFIRKRQQNTPEGMNSRHSSSRTIDQMSSNGERKRKAGQPPGPKKKNRSTMKMSDEAHNKGEVRKEDVSSTTRHEDTATNKSIDMQIQTITADDPRQTPKYYYETKQGLIAATNKSVETPNTPTITMISSDAALKKPIEMQIQTITADKSRKQGFDAATNMPAEESKQNETETRNTATIKPLEIPKEAEVLQQKKKLASSMYWPKAFLKIDNSNVETERLRLGPGTLLPKKQLLAIEGSNTYSKSLQSVTASLPQKDSLVVDGCQQNTRLNQPLMVATMTTGLVSIHSAETAAMGKEVIANQCETLQANPVIRRSRRQRNAAEDCTGEAKFGQVGFIFSKFFSSHGLYKGMVIEILPGWVRRCVYSDGDQEDLTLSELKILAKADEERRLSACELEVKRISVLEQQNSPGTVNLDRKENDGIDEDSSDSEEFSFDIAGDIIPVDDTAESTNHLERRTSLNCKKAEQNNSEDEQSAWLTKVATLVNSRAAKASKTAKPGMVGSELIGYKDIGGVGNVDDRDRSKPLTPCDAGRPIPLFRIEKQYRHGAKVVNIKDKKKIVGQVLLENHSGWVEVIVGEETKKDRLGNFVVVPSSYSIGDSFNDDIVCEEVTTAMPLAKESQVSSKTASAEKRFRQTIGTIFYWYCDLCDVTNPFVHENCGKCKQKRRRGKDCSFGKPSALLELVEHVCAVDGGVKAIMDIPPIHRRSIPPQVIDTVRKMSCGSLSEKAKLLSMSTPVPVDSIFYWQCPHCTMQNSFRRWSCITCKRKKNDDPPSSLLLKIASDAAKDQLYIQDAISRIPTIHRPSIPETVMKCLVTCIATVNKTDRRCVLPKKQHSDYCNVHQDAIQLSTSSANNLKPVVDKASRYTAEHIEDEEELDPNDNGPFLSIDELMQNVRIALRETLATQENTRKWGIKCIEDAFLCERNEPYPLGILVRRYFPGHGYHDGFVTSVKRKEVKEENEARPVLLYRVIYNDGDEEDLFHHEINSLRQIYDVRSVKPTAPSDEQIRIGTIFNTLNGRVEVIGIDTNDKDPSDNGAILARVWIPNQVEKEVEIDLMKFQKIVVYKISDQKIAHKRINHWLLSDSESGFNNSTGGKSEESEHSQLPFLEWPPPISKNITDFPSSESDEIMTLSKPGLNLHTQPFPDDEDEDNSSEEDCDHLEAIAFKVHRIADDRTGHSRRGVLQHGHDPAMAYNFISYTPFVSTKCEICSAGEEDHSLLICDDCDKGYHTYCLRPVMVNIPRGDWSCPRCTDGECTFTSFEDIVLQMKTNRNEMSSFLHLPFKDIAEFCISHKDAFALMRSRSQWKTHFPKTRVSESVGGIFLSRNKDKQLFKLPEPPQDPELIMRSISSIAAAIKYCGMEIYSEKLAYHRALSASMNNATLDLDTVAPLSKKNVQLFLEYKANLKKGVFPPLEVVYDESIGFVVKALVKIKRHTIITEYVGEVTPVDQTGNTSSDSLMNLLQTRDDSTSLIIDPSRIGNMARFFSGINNRKFMSKRKANVRTRRFDLDGECRVVLFTAKNVEAGEMLHYDYNAGIEGKDVESMVRTGFYDTSNFL